MAVPLFTNNATGTLAGGYSAVATAITLTAGQGSKYPTPTGGDWFMATIVDPSNNIEIVKVTGRATDTMTVVRGQEGTTARILAAGEKFDLRITAGALVAIRDKIMQTADLADASVTTAKLANLSVTAAKMALGSIFGIHLTPNAVDATQLAPAAAVGNLGFTPVQQGGGAGQGANKIYLGWSTTKLRAQVDATDQGYILTEKQDGGVGGAGYRGLPQNQQEANYQLGLTDSGGHVYHGGGGTHTYTVPADATPFGYGSVVQVVNYSGTVNIAPAAGVTICWHPGGLTGARVLTGPGVVTLEKIGSNLWLIAGTNLA